MNNDLPSHESIAEMLPTLLTNTRCPLCGQSGMHSHTPHEIVIYRNGVKYGRSLVGYAPSELERLRGLLGEALAHLEDRPVSKCAMTSEMLRSVIRSECNGGGPSDG